MNSDRIQIKTNFYAFCSSTLSFLQLFLSSTFPFLNSLERKEKVEERKCTILFIHFNFNSPKKKEFLFNLYLNFTRVKETRKN
ncbi:hypothetical protein BpHYR1_006653 [Brachionus plicatilis]|uniref:Uncharacterized protein n=1 Tax=Brachionus plicatilis TaxID=10195 RepID=A0A3M7R2Q5_BRAPC|nr:hypothetical protein BpHYR1_006653 [Brachionus plicatilis]